MKGVFIKLNQRFYYFLVIFLLFYEGATAQINPVFQSIQNNRKMIVKGQMKKTESIKQAPVDFFVDMGYNDSSIVKLKKVGVDIDEIRNYKRQLNEKEKVTISDCIIIGTVTKIEHPSENFEKQTEFQTIAYVNVEEYLKNDYNLPKQQISVMIVTGPTKRRVGEDTLGLGEHVLLFLDAKSLMRQMEFSKRPYFNMLINDPIVRFQIVAFNGKYLLKEGMITNRDGVKNLADVRKDIMAVIKAAH